MGLYTPSIAMRNSVICRPPCLPDYALWTYRDAQKIIPSPGDSIPTIPAVNLVLTDSPVPHNSSDRGISNKRFIEKLL